MRGWRRLHRPRPRPLVQLQSGLALCLPHRQQPVQPLALHHQHLQHQILALHHQHLLHQTLG